MPNAKPSFAPVRTQQGKVLWIVLAAALVLGGGGAAAWLFMAGGDDPDAELAEGESEPEQPRGQAIYHAFDPSFVVSLTNGDTTRFLQVELQVMTRDEAVPPALARHEPLIRNDLLLLFGAQKPGDLDTRAARQALQDEALSEIRRLLASEGEPDAVEAVYFTSFVLQ